MGLPNKKALNEKKTESYVRNKLQSLGYFQNDKITVEEQKSDLPHINKLLQNASKRGGGKGYPEFIITNTEDSNLVVVIECKADTSKHESPNKNKYADFAVDGAMLYGDYLSKEKDVLCIGVSGQNDNEMKISHYLKLKNEKIFTQVHNSNILDFKSYYNTYRKQRYRVDYENLIKFVQALNDKLNKKKIPENARAILFSGILIALEDDTFLKSYSAYSDMSRLAEFLLTSVKTKLERANIQSGRVHEMQNAFGFIKTHTALIDEGYLIELIQEIHNEIRPFIKSNEYFDIISKAYAEFLTYANNDKSLGIVLTPSHITQLFCDIANITKDSVVLDNCCGTGGFLIAAMKFMIEKANGDESKIAKIKSEQLIGVEYQDHIYTLCASNMIIHGDGKTNIIKGDCFKKKEQIIELSPTVCFLNPPYNETTGIDELDFVFNALESVTKNGVVVAILPMSCASYQNGIGAALKGKILEAHTLDAVMSMPTELFNAGTVTCIMVFKAGIPHTESNRKTWFGYWKDDGFVKVKHKGLVDKNGAWADIKEKWLHSYRNREVISGLSVMHSVTHNDEWCAEAYMETDYTKITPRDFEKTVRDYIICKLMEF